MTRQRSYLHLGENIDASKFVIVDFYVESDKDILETAEALAAESSIGTWTDVQTMNSDVFSTLAARIFYANADENIVKIAYPLELFEGENLAQLFSDVAGNVFGMKEINNLRVRDIRFPEAYVRMFEGPAFGIEGIRSVLEAGDRPLLGTIIKPKVGLSADEHAKVAYEAWVGGVDIVKDDENLTNQSFNPFEERVVKTIIARKKAEDATGKRKVYAPNISAPVSEMMDRAEFVKVQGGRVLMLDILTVGFSAVQHIRAQNFGMILHGHRAMHGAFTNNTKHGIAMLPIAKIARLAGIDQLHTGTVVGKMEGDEETVDEINDAMRKKWFDVKRTMPIASGGVHPGLIPEVIKRVEGEVIINLGGGIHGHPDGTQSGAKAAFQALEAAMEDVPLREYAKDHKELAKAIEKWGVYGDSREMTKELVTYKYGLKEK
ncbi:type III ribulose-bisphosphate carboxylase [Candidatus Dojkabacteria bacterium]|nr:type III ribulose-bisphosphate carboxylase [Candidatus Dojkabacteria bacterium]